MSADAKIEELGLQLPPAPTPLGVYKPIVIVGSLAYLSGHGPLQSNGTNIIGRVGEDLDVDAGKGAARQVGLALLSTMRNALGSLDRVKRIIKTLGLVNCTADFDQQPLVINGYSELMSDVFGADEGVGARSAIGTNSLPGNIPVEIEVIVELND